MLIPVLVATEVDGVYRAWCPFCYFDHHHSAEEGHRVAHCAEGPFKETGYWLVRRENIDPDLTFDPNAYFNPEQQRELSFSIPDEPKTQRYFTG